jgi:hypothetical protein
MPSSFTRIFLPVLESAVASLFSTRRDRGWRARADDPNSLFGRDDLVNHEASGYRAFDCAGYISLLECRSRHGDAPEGYEMADEG